MNNFREWLSDNLRYIMLFCGIAIVLVGLFFGVRAISKAYAERSGDNEFSQDSVLESAEVPTPEAETPAVTETVTPAPVETEEEPAGGELKENAYPEVNNLITAYYAALETRDPETVRGVVDTLSDEDAEKVAGASATTYSDIDVFTKAGESNGSYVVYACYNYLTEGAAASLPGLSQLFVEENDAGDLRIVTSPLSKETQAYIDKINAGADIKALVERVQTSYDSALAAAETKVQEAEAAAAEQKAAEEAAAQAAAEQKAAEEAAAQAAAEQAAAEAAAQAEAERKAAEEAAAQAAYEAEHKETPAHTLGTCNIRSGPGYEYDVVYPDLPGGSQVTVIGRTDAGWRHIRFNGIEGYVGGRFIAY